LINRRIAPELIKEEEIAAEDREGIWLYVFALVRHNSCRERERGREILRSLELIEEEEDGVLERTILG